MLDTKGSTEALSRRIDNTISREKNNKLTNIDRENITHKLQIEQHDHH